MSCAGARVTTLKWKFQGRVRKFLLSARITIPFLVRRARTITRAGWRRCSPWRGASPESRRRRRCASSRSLLRSAVSAFRKTGKLPCEGASLPAIVPGIGWSDQWSFWQCGYPAIMVTDTAPFRYPHYHEPTDTPDKLDYDRFALVVSGMEKVIAELATQPQL